MIKYALMIFVVFTAGTVAAAEEFMPLHPGAQAGTWEERTATGGSMSVVSEKPPLHRNMVRLQLPSLGPETEGRTRVVGAYESGIDGALNFDAVGPAAIGAMPDIPGLVVPEVLAADKFDLEHLEYFEPARTTGTAYEPIEPPDEIKGSGPHDFDEWQVREFPAESVRPASPVETAAVESLRPPERQRRLDIPEERAPERVTFARIEIPVSGEPVTTVHESARLDAMTMPSVAPATESRAAFAASPASAPSDLRPASVASGPSRPGAMETTVYEKPAAPAFDRELRERSGDIPVSPMPTMTQPRAKSSGRGRRVAPHPKFAAQQPVRELKSILTPIYQQSGQ